MGSQRQVSALSMRLPQKVSIRLAIAPEHAGFPLGLSGPSGTSLRVGPGWQTLALYRK
jgi:hypothetical protein